MVVGCWAGVDERWPNMASIVGRSAAPRGVERKSAGRSNCGICLFSDGRLKRKEREDGDGRSARARETKRAFDP